MPQKGIWGSNPQLSASTNLKKGPIWGPFYYQEWRLGIRTQRARALSKRESVCSPWAKSRQALKPEGMRSMPGHPQLSASTNLKKGPIWGPFFIIEKGRWGFEPSKKEASFRMPPFGERIVLRPLHLGCLGYGFAFCRKRAIVDAAAQAVELHKEPLNGIRPRAFFVGNQICDNDLDTVLFEREAAHFCRPHAPCPKGHRR